LPSRDLSASFHERRLLSSRPIRTVLPPSCPPPMPLPELSPPSESARSLLVDGDGDQNDQPLRDALHVGGHVEEIEEVVDHRDDEGTEQGSPHRADAPEQARAANDDRRDRVELDSAAGPWVSYGHAGTEDDAAQRSRQA